MKKNKIHPFAALEKIRIELSKLIEVDNLELNFRNVVDTNSNSLSLTVHYRLDNGKISNFTINCYTFDSNQSFEELIVRAKAEIGTIKPIKHTTFEIA